MPQKKGQNAFFFFMLDYKKKQERAGQSFPNGLKDVQLDPKCSEEWKNLSKQERGHYESMAKNSKVKAQGTIEKKAADGTPLKVLEERQRQKQEFQDNMLQHITSTVSLALEKQKLPEEIFLFIHSSWFCKKISEANENDYVPAEFAICAFSLKEGVKDTYHEIINAKIPMGYKREALETSETTHKIPVEFPDGESDFAVMYDRLIEFLKPYIKNNKELPPFYASKIAVQPARSFLIRLTDAVDVRESVFRVYSLEQLFTAVRKAAYQSSTEPPMHFTTAEQEIMKDSFSFSRGLACKFHEALDGTTQYCSLSIVKRWGFTIADHCCQCFDIEIIPGIHCPRTLTNTEIDFLNSRMSNISMNYTPKVLSMTGVGSDHRARVTNETYKERMQRRNESVPIEIIDHSKRNETPVHVVTSTDPPECLRPLRLPKTMPICYSQATDCTKNSAPVLSETDFPPISGGRGKLRNLKTK